MASKEDELGMNLEDIYSSPFYINPTASLNLLKMPQIMHKVNGLEGKLNQSNDSSDVDCAVGDDGDQMRGKTVSDRMMIVNVFVRCVCWEIWSAHL